MFYTPFDRIKRVMIPGIDHDTGGISDVGRMSRADQKCATDDYREHKEMLPEWFSLPVLDPTAVFPIIFAGTSG